MLTHAQDTTELDLWAFDDDGGAPEDAPHPVPPPKPSWKDLPAPRDRPNQKPHEAQNDPLTRLAPTQERIQINVNRPPMKMRPTSPTPTSPAVESEFDDLDQWAQIPDTPTAKPSPAPNAFKPTAPAPKPVAPPDPIAPVMPETDEFSPVTPANATPVSLRPHLQLSAIERVGLIVILALLIGVGASIMVFSLNDLPTQAPRASAHDFPVKGALITIDSASSYWRAPVTTGASPDTFRRGTQLLPVIELSASGGPAAIRVLFRNEDHAVVGDAVTRSLRDRETLVIPATAGFDDLGMHAAYRTGETKPWTIEVLEAPTENADGARFKRLFEINVSTDRR